MNSDEMLPAQAPVRLERSEKKGTGRFRTRDFPGFAAGLRGPVPFFSERSYGVLIHMGDSMKDKEPKDKESECRPQEQKGAMPLKPVGEVVVTHEEAAAKQPPDKKIHPRRPLPPVPKSEDQG